MTKGNPSRQMRRVPTLFVAGLHRRPNGRDHESGRRNSLRRRHTRRLCLTDGGVYDNLGLEPVWKCYKTISVSDGGAVTSPRRTPRTT